MNLFSDRQCVIASYILILVALICIIPLHLLSSFFAGFLIYEIIRSMSAIIDRYTKSNKTKIISSIVLSVIIVSILILGLTSLVSFVLHDLQGSGLTAFSNQIDKTLASIQQEIAHYLPSYIPEDVSDTKDNIVDFLKDNIETLRHAGTDLLHNIATGLIGLIVGILVSLQTRNKEDEPAFKAAMFDRISYLATSFRNVVFAQIKISLINTVLFIIFAFAILPIFGVSLPFIKTLTILTFIFGLIPIAGNLISNSLIVIAGLTISLPVATACLVYLVLIHKLEYFINAQIIGTKINAKAWEVLLAMLVFEAIFGMGGLIAAPIFYAYLKLELKEAKMI